MNGIVKNTNLYAQLVRDLPEVQERIDTTERSLFKLWTDLTFDELWVYVGLQIIMGMVHKPSIHLYWSKEHIINTPTFSRIMKRDRLEQIRKMIHFVNPLEEDHTSSLYKLTSYLDNLRDKFRNNYTPSKHVAVDEYLSLWKGRYPCRINIRTTN